MNSIIVTILIAILAVPGIAPTSQDSSQQKSPNSICEFIPWLPGCDFFK